MRSAAVGLATGLVLMASLAAAAGTPAFDLQGHRGARGLAPENTLAAFADALSIGVTTLELDVGVSRDGVVVVSHNRRLSANITRDGSGSWLREPPPALFSLSLAEIATYDVGRIDPASRYAQRFADQKPRDGSRMPTLAAVFALAERAGNREVRFNIETKTSPLEADLTLPPEAFVEAVLAVVRANRMESRVTIQSFDWRTLRIVQARAPGRLKGADITFPFVSVGAGEHLMMAACLARGETVLRNVAREPEVADLAVCLTAMGAVIEGIGTDTIRIQGADALGGGTHSVIPDRIEAGTYAIAAVMTGGGDEDRAFALVRRVGQGHSIDRR